MTGLTPNDIFPLNYPKGDPSIPERGAKAVPFILDWSKDNQYDANLLQVRDQKFFGSLRCLWIDASLCTQNFTVAVNGTEQIFTVVAGTTNYYPVINLNVPVVIFTMAVKESSVARIICLNFVPAVAAPIQVSFPGSITVSGNVAVTNFPATQPVSGTVAVNNFPASQPVTGTFWQATQPVSGTVAVNNFPASQPVTGTFWQATQPVSGTVAVNNFPSLKPSSVSNSVILDTTHKQLSLTSNTAIRLLQILYVGPVLAAGTTQLMIADGSGTTVFNVQLQIPSTAIYLIYLDLQDINLSLVNGASFATTWLSTALTGGKIILTCGMI